MWTGWTVHVRRESSEGVGQDIDDRYSGRRFVAVALPLSTQGRMYTAVAQSRIHAWQVRPKSRCQNPRCNVEEHGKRLAAERRSVNQNCKSDLGEMAGFQICDTVQSLCPSSCMFDRDNWKYHKQPT